METVRQYWAYTSSTDEQMDCTVDIEISPDGEIVSYKLMKSSGNKYFDSSAQNAIVRTQKSGVRLPPPEPLPKGMTIIFDLPPKNARWRPVWADACRKTAEGVQVEQFTG